MTRQCNMCGEVKPLDDFFANKSRKLGRAYECKNCRYELRRAAYYSKLKYNERFKEKHRIDSQIYAKNNPEKTTAHRLARTHKDELLKDSCEKCGASERLHMHHPDYSKPLEVVTLCVPCHELEHHGVKV